jgi:endonuclease/exonuclease/phosphatase family metal-dependent hydrolase
MKKYLGMLYAFLVFAGANVAAQKPGLNIDAAQIRVMSYNIRCLAVEESPGDLWWLRRSHLAEQIVKHDPDLIGMQEVYATQEKYLAGKLPGYAWFGLPRDDGKNKGERNPIVYKKDRFDLLQQNTFWLSETPEVLGSRSWDAGCKRIVTWGNFRDKKTGKLFFLFNTHFDHKGEVARRESAKLLLEKIRAIAGDAPSFVTGDFNTDPGSVPYNTITAFLFDSLKISQSAPQGPENTAWTFKKGVPPDHRIDYVFVSKTIMVADYAALEETYGKDRRPSDHISVLVDLLVP